MIEPVAGMDPALPIYVTPPANPAPEPASEAAPTGPKEFNLFGEKGFSFLDLLDIINPLQHIPVISTIYRKITGDELSPGARIAGATLFGGPIGAAIAMVDTAVEHKSGRDMGGNVMAALIGDDKPIPDGGTTAVASAGTMPPAMGFAGTAAKPSTFVAAALPDLGALNGFATSAGVRAAAAEPIKLDPRFAIEPWQAPADEQAVSETAEPAMSSQIRAKTTNRPVKMRASQATVEAAMLQVEAMRSQQSTLAATESKNDAEIAAPESQNAWRRVKPPASDIPIGAAPSLSRNATRAYAKSMIAPAPANANAAPEPARIAAAAQNDWIVESMAAAMAKYEAGHRLQTGSAQPMQAVSR